jgi:hypothetical protein
MAVTRVHLAGREQCFQEIETLVNSHILHGSESLCKLLRYLAEQTLDHPSQPVKEYQIATEVFGRPANFDPHIDSTVRVQAGRLRMKLVEYYSSEGVEDAVVVELPKGSYALSFHLRTPHLSHSHSAVRDQLAIAQEAAQSKSPGLKVAVWVLAVLLAVSAGVIGLLLTRNFLHPALARESAPPAFQNFWGTFVSGPEEPWIIFSNGAFVGRPETGMRYFNPARDNTSSVILDHYTGVGEVLAVHELDRVFGMLKKNVRVKRGTLFSLDDAKHNNLIFVGSPAENLTLLEIPSTHEFVFQRLTAGPRKGDLAIINVNPRADEPKMFMATPSNEALTQDYAVIGLVPGLDPERSILILAGTTTMGTQAAVEYVCRQDSLEELLLRLSVSQNGKLRPFEAVLRVKVTRGVPVKTDLVALRSTDF